MAIVVTWSEDQGRCIVRIPSSADVTVQDGLVYFLSEDHGQVFVVLPVERLISAVVEEGEVSRAAGNGPPVDPDDVTLWNETLEFRHDRHAVPHVAHAALTAWGAKKGLA